VENDAILAKAESFPYKKEQQLDDFFNKNSESKFSQLN